MTSMWYCIACFMLQIIYTVVFRAKQLNNLTLRVCLFKLLTSKNRGRKITRKPKDIKRDLLVFITMTPSFWIVLTVPIRGYIFLWIFFQFIWFKRSVVFLCCWQVRVHQWNYAFVSHIKWFSLKFRVLCCGFSILQKKKNRWRNN